MLKFLLIKTALISATFVCVVASASFKGLYIGAKYAAGEFHRLQHEVGEQLKLPSK